mgnify:CR=1 FL=1
MSNYGSFNPSAVAKLVLGAVFFTLFGCGESSVPEKSASKKSAVKKIEKIKKVIKRKLMNIYHVRVEYPD